MTPLPDALAAARTAAGLSQAEAARRAGVSRATVQNAETGRYDTPSLRTLQALAQAYRIDLGALLSPHDGDGSDRSEGVPETDRAPATTAARR